MPRRWQLISVGVTPSLVTPGPGQPRNWWPTVYSLFVASPKDATSTGGACATPTGSTRHGWTSHHSQLHEIDLCHQVQDAIDAADQLGQDSRPMIHWATERR